MMNFTLLLTTAFLSLSSLSYAMEEFQQKEEKGQTHDTTGYNTLYLTSTGFERLIQEQLHEERLEHLVNKETSKMMEGEDRDVCNRVLVRLQKDEKLEDLEHIDIEGYNVSDLTPLTVSQNLQTLNLKGTLVRDITALEKVISLQSLSLAGTKVDNITALKGLSHLWDLNLKQTLVRDITDLKQVTRLEFLSLAGTKVDDITALGGLPNLSDLNLKNTQVKDITALEKVPGLEYLDLNGTRVSEQHVIDLSKTLPGCTIFFQKSAYLKGKKKMLPKS